jgi:hypothetical protein
MPRYVAESFLARTADVRAQADQAEAAAHALEAEYVRFSFLQEDELCLHWFVAPSAAVVDAIGRRAHIDFDRIVETVEEES